MNPRGRTLKCFQHIQLQHEIADDIIGWWVVRVHPPTNISNWWRAEWELGGRERERTRREFWSGLFISMAQLICTVDTYWHCEQANRSTFPSITVDYEGEWGSKLYYEFSTINSLVTQFPQQTQSPETKLEQGRSTEGGIKVLRGGRGIKPGVGTRKNNVWNQLKLATQIKSCH